MPSIQESARKQLSDFLELKGTIQSLNANIKGLEKSIKGFDVRMIHAGWSRNDDFSSYEDWEYYMKEQNEMHRREKEQCERKEQELRRQKQELSGHLNELPTLSPKIRKSLLLPDPTQSARVEFLGSEDFSRGGDVIVSFPGVHGLAWTMLTTKGLKYQSGGRPMTSCIFLPDPSCEGYGKHMEDAFETCKCWCYKLYGQSEDFGCKWYDLWMAKTRKAADAGCNLILVTKEGGGLGNSQKGEKKFLIDELRYPFKEIDINEFADLIVSPTDADFQWFLEENGEKLVEILSGPSTSVMRQPRSDSSLSGPSTSVMSQFGRSAAASWVQLLPRGFSW